MYGENQYLTGLAFNHEEMLHAKKVAKLIIFLAFLGVLAGLSASPVFYGIYNLYLTTIFAALSGNILIL
jgi:hypothetical protein